MRAENLFGSVKYFEKNLKVNIEYNIEETNKKIGEIMDKLNVLNLQDSIFELKTLLDYYEGLYNVYFHSIAHGTSSKEIAQTNTNDSDAKTILDAWYATNLASYSSYISDTIFCNDRQIQDNYIKYGFGPEGTVYRAGVGGAITLKCASQNDRFTVADEVLGNKKLSYPIGLINIDEAMIAGGTATNKKYYLYTGYAYWTMTPNSYNSTSANVRIISSSGTSSGAPVDSTNTLLRPVINLKAGVLNSGTGLWNDPYKII